MLVQTSEEYAVELATVRAKAAKTHRVGRSRFAAVDLGYPRDLFGVWDFQKSDTVRRGSETRKFTSLDGALREAARLNDAYTAEG